MATVYNLNNKTEKR